MLAGTQKQKGISTVQLVIILLFVLILVGVFHKPLARLLESAETIKVKGPNNIEVEIKARDTPIGQVAVGVPPAAPAGVPLREGISGNTYTSQRYRFQISWPSGDRWKPILNVPFSRRQELGLSNSTNDALPIEITNAGGDWVVFPVSVIVGVRPATNNSIEAYVDEAVQRRKAQGWTADWSVDAETRSALIVLSLQGNNTNQVELQRIVLSANQVYTLTTGRMLDQVIANAQAKLDITSILNSFRVL